MESGDDLMTLDEVAARLRVDRQTIRLRCVSGEICSIRVGSSWRISQAKLAKIRARARIQRVDDPK